MAIEDGLGDEDIEADNIDEALEEAIDWTREGSWSAEGCRVTVYVHLLTDEDENDFAVVEIEPDHEALIKEALNDAQWTSGCCGLNPDDHKWTSKGEGGCTENPGVWSHGGTTISTSDHCSMCGLRRSQVLLGDQRNPGEIDTTTYTLDEELLKTNTLRGFVDNHEDDDDFDDQELEEMFILAYDREPDDDDRDQGLWSHICAAVL